MVVKEVTFEGRLCVKGDREVRINGQELARLLRHHFKLVFAETSLDKVRLTVKVLKS